MIICITGHRPNGLPREYGYNLNNKAWTKLKKYIEVTIEECYKYATPNKELTLVTGMALGVDMEQLNYVKIIKTSKLKQPYHL